MPNNLFITGESGVGKSVALAAAAEELFPRRISGFVSPRNTVGGVDQGWSIEGFNGVSGVVTSRDIVSDHQLGTSGVDMELFDRCVEAELESYASSDVALIDEIGIIGGWSPRFIAYVEQVMESTIPLVAIVREKSGYLSDRVKQRDDSVLWTTTLQNRDDIAGEIARWVESFDTPT
mgnify:FL=1|jgi:nucleoside-triphosphatase THEP1